MTKFRRDPGYHPQATETTDGGQAYYFKVALFIRAQEPEGQHLDLKMWRAAAQQSLQQLHEQERTARSRVQLEQKLRGRGLNEIARTQRLRAAYPGDGWPDIWHLKLSELDEYLRQMQHKTHESIAAHEDFSRQLDALAKLSADEQRQRIEAIYRNWVGHAAEQFGEVAGTQIVPPDWQAVSGELQTASSEPTVLNLETAYERGKFETKRPNDPPIADISGNLGSKRRFTVSAELMPLPTEDVTDGRERVRQVAEEMRDPRLGTGPRTGEIQSALMSFWITRKGRAGYVTVTIAQLAEALHYAKGKHGYEPAVYEQIREYVKTLAGTYLTASEQPDKDGKRAPGGETRIEGGAFNITYADKGETSGRPSKGWTSLVFRPGPLFEAAAGRDGAYLMGADPALNKLSPRKQTYELLLAKYLERAWRTNWDTSPGIVVRRVRTLLNDGMSVSEAGIKRPAQIMDHLEITLEKLKERGTVRDFTLTATWTAVQEQLAAGRRMSKSMWAAVLDSTVTIEAGKAYHAQYKNHGLMWKGAAGRHPLVADLHDILQTTNKPQATIAEAIGIKPARLSSILKTGKVPADIEPKLDAWLTQNRTLPLDFDGPTK